MFAFTPLPLFGPQWASVGCQSAGSSSAWEPEPVSKQTAAFWPPLVISSLPQAHYEWFHTPGITQKQKQS